MTKVSAVICTFNEEHNVPDLIASLQGADEIILADDGSTDKTKELAEALGAKVMRRKDWSTTATENEVVTFCNRFGWKPRFVAGSKIGNGGALRTEALSFAKNDWVVMPDADERITWDLNAMEPLFDQYDQITCDFVHSHNADGSPVRVSTITKLFRKSVSKIDGRIHDVLLPTNRMVYTNKMRIDHWQKPNAVDASGNPVHSQSSVLPIMEYSVIEKNDLRSRFYLGREYYYYHEYDKAIRLLDEYLKDANWVVEIGHAHLYKARCYWESMRGDEARAECLEAIKINPDHKEALYLYSEMHFEPWKSKWKFIADNATEKDILF